MRRARHLVILTAFLAVAAPWSAHAEGFSADYSLSRFNSPGVQMQAGTQWFGQVGVDQGLVSSFGAPASHDVLNLGGGYRWANGQSLSLQLSRGRGPGQRLGLALNYDWPRYFVRLSYDQGLYITPADNLRFSAGVRF